MTSNIDNLRKWLGIRTSKRSKPTLLPTKRLEPDFETPQQKGMRDALHKSQRDHQRYVAARTERLARLCRDVPHVARYLSRLESITADVTASSTRDCDTDLGGIATAYKLAARIERTYDRFLVFECTAAWLTNLARQQGITDFDDADVLPLDGREVTALDQLKDALQIF